jgi:hypothetical protein
VGEDNDITAGGHVPAASGDHPIVGMERRAHRIVDDREPTG